MGIVKSRSSKHLLVQFFSSLVKQTVLGHNVSPASDVMSERGPVDSGEGERCAGPGPLCWVGADSHKPGLTLEKSACWVWVGGGRRVQPSARVGLAFTLLALNELWLLFPNWIQVLYRW